MSQSCGLRNCSCMVPACCRCLSRKPRGTGITSPALALPRCMRAKRPFARGLTIASRSSRRTGWRGWPAKEQCGMAWTRSSLSGLNARPQGRIPGSGRPQRTGGSEGWSRTLGCRACQEDFLQKWRKAGATIVQRMNHRGWLGNVFVFRVWTHTT
jgi:hypothetical protein